LNEDCYSLLVTVTMNSYSILNEDCYHLERDC